MVKFLRKIIGDHYKGKLLSFLLIFSIGISPLRLQVINGLEAEKKPRAETSLPFLKERDKLKRQENFNENGNLLYENNTFISLDPNFTSLGKERKQKVNRKIKVTLTAYSSTFFECDSNPFKTASGSYVRDGIVATNFLPFGTKIKIPNLFEDKVFVVEDRMAKRYWYTVDIWMPDYKKAINFGKRYAEIEILD